MRNIKFKILPSINASLDCKTVGFFLKISKQIGKAWRKSLTRVSPQSRSLFSASLQTFCLTARAYLNTQKYGLFCSLMPAHKTARIFPATNVDFHRKLKQSLHKLRKVPHEIVAMYSIVCL